MANLKLSPSMFIGVAEMQHLLDGVQDKGYKRILSKVIKNFGIGTDSFEVTSTGIGNISVGAGVGVDSNSDIIYAETNQVDVLTVPGDSVTRNVVISYLTDIVETGTVSVAADGTITGTGTLFTSTLRGGGTNSSKITFPNSATNTSEYAVNSVSSDTVATLNVADGILTVEAGETYTVVGSFLPGATVAGGDKYPLIKDFFTVSLQATATALTDGLQFVLAEVTNTGGSQTIVDKRHEYRLSVSDIEITNGNAIVGVEEVIYPDTNISSYNVAKVGWSFRSSAFTYSEALSQVTITAGAGGIYTDTTSFTTGDFDDWAVYFVQSGIVRDIVSSTLSGTDILLVIDGIAASAVSGSTEVFVIPKSKSVVVEVVGTNSNNSSKTVFDTAQGVGDVFVEGGTISTIKYAHGNEFETSGMSNINDGTYLNEAAHDVNGDVTGATTGTVVSAQLTPTSSTSSPLVPIGGIIMWDAAIGTIPSNYNVCDGTNGTPDLRDKFVVGAGSAYTLAGTGGAATVTLSVAEMPAHNHSNGLYTNILQQDGTGTPDGTSAPDVSGTEPNITTSAALLSSGGGAAHENLPPYYAIYYIKRIS